MKIRLTTFAAVALVALMAAPAWGQDAAALYKTKCVMCHGDQGQGKAALGTKLAGISKSEAEIVAVLTKGGLKKVPHIKGIASLTPDQAKALAVYVKTLK